METIDIKVEDFTAEAESNINTKVDSINTTVCVRCGKQRIVLSVTKGMAGNSPITTTETICPDPDCQKKVDGMLGLEQEKRHQSFLLREARMSSKKQVKTSN